MNLSKNLTLFEMLNSETAKRKGIDNIPENNAHIDSMILVANNIFQPIREYFNTPIFVSSGYRSIALNIAIGGSSVTSQHMKGEAMDLDADRYGKISNSEIFNYIRECLDFDQLIWEYGNGSNPDWVHVSYKPEGNRKQVLKVKRVNGKGLYSAY
tara:strand:- start:59 stop:523 length:465 start_codon:yes stop_codon:yes gene_type:complete